MGSSNTCYTQTLKNPDMYNLLRQQKNKKIFAVVDCDNFFVSCERVFRPDLKSKPVAVLSNNDGCIVSRSKEVKELGIPMGAPVFKFKNIIQQKKITLFSGNFSLYGDMSNRVMSILKDSVSQIYIYSIDEAFIDLTNQKVPAEDYELFCTNLRSKIKIHTGIPVSIGIASTKTLAKIASKLAKKGTGVFDMTKLTDSKLDKLFTQFDIADIWGIGRKLAPKLKARGIFTAYDLKNYDPKILQKLTNVTGERISLELNDISCINLHTVTMPRKNIASTRSFGRNIIDIRELREAITNYTAKACKKLRQQDSIAQKIGVYIRTDRFKNNNKYTGFEVKKLPCPSSDTRYFTKAALEALSDIFKSGHDYAKAGVFIFDIRPRTSLQENLLSQDYHKINILSRRLMKAIDKIDAEWGCNTIRLGSAGFSAKWKARCRLRSPRYTSKWAELLQVST